MADSTGTPLKRLVDMNWPEVARVRERTDAVIIPVGQVAQHGRHLPLNADVIQAEEVCRRTVMRLGELGTEIALGPSLHYGHSPLHRSFPGYITLRPETLTRLLYDVIASLAAQGFRKFVVMNVGGGNWSALENALYHAEAELNVEAFLLGWFELAPVWASLLETHKPEIGESDGHAGELETSCVLAVAPHLVVMEQAQRYHSPVHTELQNLPFINMNINERCRAAGFWDQQAISPSGAWGDPTAATAEKGSKIFDAAARAVADHIRKYVMRVDAGESA